MAEVLLFHHALGVTAGVRAFSERLEHHGHTVHLPDLFRGRTFDSLDDGVAHVEEVGVEPLVERGAAVAEDLPADVVYAGMSLGAMPAQWLARRRPGARGVVLYHGGVPASLYGGRWPDGVPLQMHVMAEDEHGDVDVLHDLAEQSGGTLHLYAGRDHLFTDSSTAAYDAEATDQVVERTVAFLDEVGRSR